MTDHIDKLFLKEIVSIYMGLTQVSENESGSIKGYAKNNEEFNNFKDILQKYNEHYDLEYSCNVSNFQIKFCHPEGTFASFQKLLSSSTERRKIPYDNFYIRDVQQAYYSDEEPTSSEIKSYLQNIDLFSFLTEKCDHINFHSTAYELIFLDKKKLIISDEYNSQSLIELLEFEDFKNKFCDDAINIKEKNHILKKSLVNFFEPTDKVQLKIKLSDVIEQFTKLCNYINDELDLYMSNFSYEAIKKEVEKDKVDFTVRLNKVFSDIQAQLIGVPVSVILAANGMNLLKTQDTQNNLLIFSIDSKNLLIFAGILFYAFMLTMLIRNQQNTLDALKDEINSHQKLLEAKHKAIADKFKNSFNQINKRYLHQKTMLLWVDIAVSLAFGLVFLLFFYYTFTEILFPLMIMSLIYFLGLIFFNHRYRNLTWKDYFVQN